MKRVGLASLVFSCGLTGALAQMESQGVEDGIVLETHLSQTAVRVGDVFEYRITVRYPQDFAFVTQGLEESLIINPFELLDLQIEEKEAWDERQLNLVLQLTCYQQPGLLRIPSLDLFYYPRTALPEGTSVLGQDIPARPLRVPPRPIQLQSTLLGDGDRLRDPVAVMRYPGSRLILPALSAAVLLAVVVGLAFLGVRHVIRSRKAEEKDNLERVREETLNSLLGLLQGTSQEGLARSALELSKVIRHYLHSCYGILSQALTPEEIRDQLQERAGNPELAVEVEGLLEACDTAYFGSPDESAADLSELCAQAASLVKSNPAQKP